VTPTDVDAFMSQPVDMDQFHEVTLALLDDRGEVIEMPRHTHGKGVRARPQPAPIKVKKPSK